MAEAADEVLLAFDAGRRAQKALREAAQSQLDDLVAEVADALKLSVREVIALVPL